MDAVKCSGTPAHSHCVTNHFRVEWNTIPGRSSPSASLIVANRLVTIETVRAGNNRPCLGSLSNSGVHVAPTRRRDAEQAILPLIPTHLAHQPVQRATLFGIGRLQCPAMQPCRRQSDLELAKRLVDGRLDGVVARQGNGKALVDQLALRLGIQFDRGLPAELRHRPEIKAPALENVDLQIGQPRAGALPIKLSQNGPLKTGQPLLDDHVLQPVKPVRISAATGRRIVAGRVVAIGQGQQRNAMSRATRQHAGQPIRVDCQFCSIHPAAPPLVDPAGGTDGKIVLSDGSVRNRCPRRSVYFRSIWRGDCASSSAQSEPVRAASCATCPGSPAQSGFFSMPTAVQNSARVRRPFASVFRASNENAGSPGFAEREIGRRDRKVIMPSAASWRASGWEPSAVRTQQDNYLTGTGSGPERSHSASDTPRRNG